jgi:rhamnulokinase
MASKQVIAVDLGAESGRVMRVGLDGSSLTSEEVHRFPNTPVPVGDTLHWNVLSLWQGISEGIDKAGTDAASIGVDSWGVDFALLDSAGNLLANPVHYRDSRTDGMMEWVFERIPRREVFQRTGIQFLQLNTLYQLASLVATKSPLLDAAATFVTIADLFNTWLSGSKTCEYTFASTTQFYNPALADWDRDMLDTLGIPSDIFPPIKATGSQIGEYKGTPVILPACHDTGSAVVGVPTTTKNYAYLSSGTWSLIGLEIDAPIINDAAYEANVTNEGGAFGTIRLLKNVMGLWLVQQCRAIWAAEGNNYSYEDLMVMAERAEPFQSLIDPDDGRFLPPGDMPARIREFCAQTGQPIPQRDEQIIRCIYESLALKYRYVLEKFIALTGQSVDRLHIIGGGSQNVLLNQMTANAIGRLVIAGPAEATALGNAIVQFIALGELADIAQAREFLSIALQTRTFEANDTARFDEQYERFIALVQGRS